MVKGVNEDGVVEAVGEVTMTIRNKVNNKAVICG